MVFRMPSKYFCLNHWTSMRCFSNLKSAKILVENLSDRALLRVSGEDVLPFLQGLVTNDTKHLEDGAKSMYTLFLNNRGRVMYDAIIYPWKEERTYLIDCDRNGLQALKKHLSMYKVRRKISIDELENEFSIWVLCNSQIAQKKYEKECSDHCDNNSSLEALSTLKGVVAFVDPRVSYLGVRAIVPNDLKFTESLADSGLTIENESFFKNLRYKLGIGEGTEELPVGNCLPLEANADYLHGVSFHKGCYIGQELTARTHHTGVIRKRLMPLCFDEDIDVTSSATITPNDDSQRVLGKLRGVDKKMGLGLLRIEESLKAPFRMEATSGALKPADEKISFECYICKQQEDCFYFGTHPPYCSKKITFNSPVYLMKNPFHASSRNADNLLIIGSQCTICHQVICYSKDCSLYFGEWYCRHCAVQKSSQFPEAIQGKIKKNFS